MKQFILGTLTLTLLGGGAVFAKANCTNEPRNKWMSEADFKAMAEKQGYKIRKFKQPGTCYEIYGSDKDGRDIEIYFNPVDGSIVKSK